MTLVLHAGLGQADIALFDGNEISSGWCRWILQTHIFAALNLFLFNRLIM